MLPISSSPPTPEETQETTKIETLIQHVCESKEQLAHRVKVLQTLERILQVWVEHHNGKMKLYPFGSYALGVQGPGSDIDVLMCGSFPRDFVFQDLGKILELHPDLKDYSLVAEAFTPVIKFTLKGIDIDLIYSQAVEIDFLKVDPATLKGLCPKDMNSLNGYRVNTAIINIVPNADAFRTTLRFIKLWAKNRYLYSNIMGYLGGISWALLVAHICLLYPKATASVCLAKFFHFYSLWEGKAQITISDARLDRPSHDLIKILTPVTPCMNSTHNVTPTTWRIIQKELKRGHELAAQQKWSKVLEKRNFFKATTYLGIEVDDQTKGFIESRLRHFFVALEQEGSVQVLPYPHCIQHKFFIGLRKTSTTKQVDARAAVQRFQTLVDMPVKITAWSKQQIQTLL